MYGFLRRLTPCVLLAAVASGALAQAAGKPSMTAPASASVGDTIAVSAKNLHRGRYSLRLYATKTPNPDWACAATIATAKSPGVAVTLRGKVPKRLACGSGFPTSDEGTIKVVPGRYRLAVSVRSSSIATAPGSSVVTRRFTVKP